MSEFSYDKLCVKCKKYKLLDEFSKNKAAKDNLNYTCKKCDVETWTKYLHTKNGKIHSMYGNMKKRVNRGKVFYHKYIDFSCFEKFCYSSKIFNSLYDNWVLSKFEYKLSPSLDRVDNNKGYTVDNLQFLTHSENSRKGSFERSNRKIVKDGYKSNIKYKKKCSNCGEYLSKSKFWNNYNTEDGLNPECRSCIKTKRNSKNVLQTHADSMR